MLVKERQALGLDVDMEGDEPEEMTIEQANIAALPEALAEIMSGPAPQTQTETEPVYES